MRITELQVFSSLGSKYEIQVARCAAATNFASSYKNNASIAHFSCTKQLISSWFVTSLNETTAEEHAS